MKLLHWYRAARKKNRKAFTLVELMVVVAIAGALASLSVVKYENFVCRTQEGEAKVTLMNIYQVETALFAEFGTYDALADCTFGYGPPVCTGSHIVVQFKGRSRFTYSADTSDTAGFVGTAVGTTGHVLGGRITVNQNGTLDLSGSVCGGAP